MSLDPLADDWAHATSRGSTGLGETARGEQAGGVGGRMSAAQRREARRKSLHAADSVRDLTGFKEGPGREVSEARRHTLTQRGSKGGGGSVATAANDSAMAEAAVHGGSEFMPVSGAPAAASCASASSSAGEGGKGMVVTHRSVAKPPAGTCRV